MGSICMVLKLYWCFLNEMYTKQWFYLWSSFKCHFRIRVSASVWWDRYPLYRVQSYYLGQQILTRYPWDLTLIITLTKFDRDLQSFFKTRGNSNRNLSPGNISSEAKISREKYHLSTHLKEHYIFTVNFQWWNTGQFLARLARSVLVPL